MSHPSADMLLYGDVTDEVVAALRAGRRPDVSDLARRHPELADRIDQLARLFTDELADVLWPTAPAPLPVRPLPPVRLGEFRLIREIGRGGMGIVYEAQQETLGRRVALKLLPFTALLDERRLQRFQNEARAAAQLQHPHIVPVHAVGCEGGVHYYAMRLIEGQGLAAALLRFCPKRPDCVTGRGNA